MLIFIIKYIVSIIAMISTLLFLSEIITSIINVRDVETAYKSAKVRFYLILVMSITWPIIFLI
jgi:hypothetical protein